MAQPGDPDPVADGERGDAGTHDLHLADDLVPGHHISTAHRQVTLSHVQIGATDPAGEHAHEQLVGARLWRRPVHERQRLCSIRPGVEPAMPSCAHCDPH